MASDGAELVLDDAPTDDAMLVGWSELYEDATGYDSVATIDRVYLRTDHDHPNGAIRCCFPGCDFKRRDPVAMWRHVHLSAKHRQTPEDAP